MSLIINSLFKKNAFNICNQLSNQELLLNLNKFLCPLIQNHDKRYAGHSKWQNIRHTKASKDGLKSKLYNRIAISVTKAALKGTDPKYNKELANILEIARKSNVSKDLIDRAIKRSQEQRLTSKQKGFIGPNNVVGIASFLYDPRFTRPSTFLKPVHRDHKQYRFVDFKTLLSFFDKKGFLFISKYDKNSNPVNFEKVEEVAIEAEVEEILIESEEDKVVPPLEVKEEDENTKKKDKSDQQIIEDEDMLDSATVWKLIVDEEGLLAAKGIVEKNYPDLIVKAHSVEYIPKEPVTLSVKELEAFQKFCSDLSEVEEFEKVYTNVN